MRKSGGKMERVPHPNNYLRDLHCFLSQKLTDSLDENDAWKRVAAEFRIFDWRDIETMRRKPSPAAALLMVLDMRNCTVRHLCSVLSKCQLWEPLALLSEPEPLRILVQPGNDENDVFIPYGGELRLEVAATGVPPPQYQWLRENEDLEDQRNCVLVIKDFEPEHVGEYSCRVSQEGGVEKNTTSVMVRMYPEPPVIQVQPQPISVHLGEEIILTCEATGYPLPQYEWMHGNMILIGQNDSNLRIECASSSHSGDYKCCVSNQCAETDSKTVRVSVFPRPAEQAVGGRPQLIVEEKVALLIANDVYENLELLHTPRNDVQDLSSILTRLGFKVIALCNLTLTEMNNAVKKFSEMVPRGAYVFFYFVGHGFKLHEKYMLPVDCPQPGQYRRTDSLCENFVLKEVLDKKPSLLVLLLDMCLRAPSRKENPEIFVEQFDPISYEADRNLIQGYATTCNMGAFERRSERNGIYVKHLQKFLGEDRPIIRILEDVINSISQESDDAARLQMPSHAHNVLSDLHYLTVPTRENPRTKGLYASYTSLQETSVIDFIQKKLPVRFQLYKKCFHNVVEMHLPLFKELKWDISTDSKVLLMEEIESDTPEVSVGIFNLQKHMIDSLTISVMLRNRETHQLYTNGLLEVSCLPIVAAQLWFESPLHD